MPDPQDPQTFVRSKLEWDEVDAPAHASMLEWYRRMISLRRSLAVLTDGRRDQVRTSFDEKQGWLLVSRGPVTVAVNLGADTVIRPLAAPQRGPVEMLAASEAGVTLVDGTVVLPPDSVAVIKECEQPFAT